MITVSKSLMRTAFVRVMTPAFCVGLALTGCQKSDARIEEAKEKVVDARQELKEIRRDVRADWQEDWVKFKRDNDQDVASNERRTIDLRREVAAIETRHRAKYSDRITELERRNYELRDRVNNCKDEGDVQWQAFKKSMKLDMDNLKSSLKNVTIKNS